MDVVVVKNQIKIGPDEVCCTIFSASKGVKKSIELPEKARIVQEDEEKTVIVLKWDDYKKFAPKHGLIDLGEIIQLV